MPENPFPDFNEISPRIKQLLLSEWDPIGVASNPDAQSEYDGFILPIYLLLKNGASEKEIGAFLHTAKTKQIGLFDGVFHRRRNRAIARKLIALIA